MVVIKNAIENIKSNKLRVAVAMIWIVLGITSVIVVSSIGNGVEKQSRDMKLNPEFRKINMTFYPNYDSPISDPAFYEPFTQEDIDKISTVKGVERVTPTYGDNMDIDYTQLISDYGDDFVKINEYKKDKKLDIKYGRNFSIEDLDRKTIILQYDTAQSLFYNDAKSAIGEAIDINGQMFEIIGVLSAGESGIIEKEEFYQDTEIYLPKNAITQLNNKVFSSSSITGVEILVLPEYENIEVEEEIQKIFEDTKDQEIGNYGAKGGSDHQGGLEHLQQTINRFTSILAKVALLIGGIGIMNIMYMSVAERKSEIGIRRAIGAEPKDILIQFIIETIVITIIGGIVGMIVGTFASNYVSSYVGIEAIPNFMVYLNAFLVSVLTGAIFGSIPALKAAKLDPIKAIQGQ